MVERVKGGVVWWSRGGEGVCGVWREGGVVEFGGEGGVVECGGGECRGEWRGGVERRAGGGMESSVATILLKVYHNNILLSRHVSRYITISACDEIGRVRVIRKKY